MKSELGQQLWKTHKASVIVSKLTEGSAALLVAETLVKPVGTRVLFGFLFLGLGVRVDCSRGDRSC